MFSIHKMLSFWNVSYREPLLINDFKEVRYDSMDTPPLGLEFVRNKPGGVLLEYYDKDNRIGYIRYYNTTGQIGLFFIDEEYKNRGLGKQILSKIIKELKMNNCKGVWAVTTTNHPFWSNVYNKSFTYKDPVHSSVTGDGYFMDLY